jgi:hypothetical protein
MLHGYIERTWSARRLIGYTFQGSQALGPLSSPTQVEEKGLLTVVHDKSISGDYALQQVTCP